MQLEINNKQLVDEIKKNKINLKDPITIEDKINWLKIYDCTPLKGKCADKLGVHEYVIDKLGKDICVPVIKVYDDVKEINFDELPNKFVLKANHGYNMNIICNDKTKLNKNDIINKCKKWLSTDFGYESCQPHYSYIRPKIFAENLLYDEKQQTSLYDYKFWCFNGEPKLWTINDGHGHGDIMYYDMNDKPINLYGVEYNNAYEKPKNFDLMVDYAKKLSTDFYFVRVDFYEVNDVVYLGELTFTPGRGYFRYKTPEDEVMVGNMLTLPKPKKYEDGVSICLTGFKVAEYVEDTLDSIKKQTWLKKHDNWEILLGIDCCDSTLKKVQSIMHKYKNLRVFMMDSNRGTYVTTNTVMTIAKYDKLIRFDCDDIMKSEMIEVLVNNMKDADFINFKMKNFGRRKDIQWACGQIMLRHELFDKFGGYMPWSCSADSELEIRLRNFVRRKRIEKVLFDRRIHMLNLTVAKATNFASPERKKNLKYCETLKNWLKKQDDAISVKMTNTYKEIFKDTKYVVKPSDKVAIKQEIVKNVEYEASGNTKQASIKALNSLVENQNKTKTKALELLNKNKVKEEPTKAEKIFETKKEENKVRVKTVKVDKQPKMLDPRFDSNW